ncbi:unnamed protein product [Acanthoscelides obtectus]|uniref:Uncharacterized protein n=1 Tax=Acanthoscelides obtectus TaxID=200917 RepID=A0A9P0NZT4_ACAOB|nr:unnamed protein product [Acanthoscelides obtectus]CAK1633801.1 hypothetical protein AOBTE_LOCUS8399 [Acanthoscelides obtectus]
MQLLAAPILVRVFGAPPDRYILPDKDAFISQLLENNKKQQETIVAKTKLIEKMSLQIDELQRQINKLLQKS